jgi:hypothetical protein
VADEAAQLSLAPAARQAVPEGPQVGPTLAVASAIGELITGAERRWSDQQVGYRCCGGAAVQNCQPAGAGGQDRSGRQSGGGDHPGGGGGQPGGALKCQPVAGPLTPYAEWVCEPPDAGRAGASASS